MEPEEIPQIQQGMPTSFLSVFTNPLHSNCYVSRPSRITIYPSMTNKTSIASKDIFHLVLILVATAFKTMLLAILCNLPETWKIYSPCITAINNSQAPLIAYVWSSSSYLDPLLSQSASDPTVWILCIHVLHWLHYMQFLSLPFQYIKYDPFLIRSRVLPTFLLAIIF